MLISKSRIKDVANIVSLHRHLRIKHRPLFNMCEYVHKRMFTCSDGDGSSLGFLMVEVVCKLSGLFSSLSSSLPRFTPAKITKLHHTHADT